MKIELIKKTDLEKTYYYTTVNDSLIMESYSLNEHEAKQKFLKIIELKGQTESGEMIDCTIIPE